MSQTISYRMLATGALAALALVLTACASAPRAPEPFTAEQFKAEMDATRTTSTLPGGDDFARVRALTALMERPEITPDQKIEALYLRAVLKGTTAEDRPGAIADYQAVIEKAPEGHRLIKPATENRDYARTQMEQINRRLAQGPASPDYLNDLLQSGRHAEAVKFIRDRRLSPTNIQLEKLHKLGFLCEGTGYSGPSYSWGYSNTRQMAVQWCDTKTAQ